MLRVLLVDDEPPALARMAAGFSGLSGAVVVGTASDGHEAAARIAELKPDLVILDIQMPGQNGIAVAAGLQGEARPEIVFVTAFEHYAPAAFEVEATDYLLKPVKFDRLRLAVDRARHRRDLRAVSGRAAELESVVNALRTEGREAPPNPAYDQEIWAPSGQGMRRVPVESIDWIEAARDYVLLHTASRSHIVRATMSALERRLDPRDMLRVHRSAFVRPAAVAEVLKQGKGLLSLVLRDGSEVQVGPAYTKTLVAALNLGAGNLEVSSG